MSDRLAEIRKRHAERASSVVSWPRASGKTAYRQACDDVYYLLATVARLTAQIEAVKALHSDEHTHYSPFTGTSVVTCAECGDRYPCRTIRTLTEGENTNPKEDHE
jgi:hypothetical protein